MATAEQNTKINVTEDFSSEGDMHTASVSVRIAYQNNQGTWVRIEMHRGITRKTNNTEELHNDLMLEFSKLVLAVQKEITPALPDIEHKMKTN